MEKFEIVVNENIELMRLLRKNLPLLSNYQIEKLFKDKDVKVNGVRKTKPCIVRAGDKVEAYFVANAEPWCDIVFEDDNILLVRKRAGIEVISEDDRNLYDILCLSYSELYSIHRIDRKLCQLKNSPYRRIYQPSWLFYELVCHDECATLQTY